MSISGDIATALLVFDEDGHLLSQWNLSIASDELHRIFNTEDSIGNYSDRDLIGQIKKVPYNELPSYVEGKYLGEVQKFSQHIFILHTYFKASSDVEVHSSLDFFIDIFLKRKGLYLGNIQIFGIHDLVELREVLGLPAGHSLIGDFALPNEWQSSFFKKFGIDLNIEFVDLVFSSSR